MQIKIQLGKLKLSLPLKELIKNQQDTNALSVSPVTLTQGRVEKVAKSVQCVGSQNYT